jgi:hypothetical protein
MMQFLRKQQKKFFIVTVLMMFASFAFFGNSSGFSSHEVEDKKIGKAVDGTSIFDRDIKALTQFLSMGSSDIMRSDLLETGAFSLLAEKYFSEIEGDFQERLVKARTATFYSHPQAPFLNAKSVWSRFSPQLVQDLREVQTGSCSPKTYSTYAQLYLDQQAFPPELLRTILLYEQQNYSWIPPDYQLSDTRYLSLFGYHSFDEWFGSRFSEILGKFILNTASIAEKKGYKVSQKEARSDFMMMCYQALRMKSMRQEVAAQDATEYMRHQLQMAGVDESRAVGLWRKVMLVHRYFQDMQQGVLLDAIPYEQFSSFADAKAHVEVYQLPELLRFKDFRSMLKVQFYLEAVSPKGKQSIVDFPRQYYSVDDVEKKFPQLVISRYELEVAKASQEDVASRLSLREMWDYEVSDAGWSVLISEYPVLSKEGDREKILDACDPELRKKIDRLARQMIVQNHADWIQKKLLEQSAQNVVVEIKSKGAVAPFDDIEDTSLLRQALQKAEIGETIHFTSLNQLTHYQIKVLKKPDNKEIMTLKSALESDLLGTLLDEKLEAAFVDARKKDTAIYKASDGTWKPFSEVRDHVGAYVYSDLLKNISSDALSYDEYACKRFEQLMVNAKISIQKERDQSKFLTTVGQTLVDQWTLAKRHQEIKRSDTTDLPKTEMFTGNIGTWSSVATPHGGNVTFFHLLQRDTSEIKIHDLVTEGQKLIGRDVTRQRIQVLLDEVGAL